MLLKEISEILKAEVLVGEDSLNVEICAAEASDLMSDVLSFTKPGVILLTGLANSHTIRTAELADLAAIIFVRGKKPNRETLNLAKAKRIPLLSTYHHMFEACGLLAKKGLKGTNETSV
ncbi:MAG: DRTGG domain-containing protein [Candidatus Edwardsbacteria bacterium]